MFHDQIRKMLDGLNEIQTLDLPETLIPPPNADPAAFFDQAVRHPDLIAIAQLSQEMLETMVLVAPEWFTPAACEALATALEQAIADLNAEELLASVEIPA